MHGICTIFTGQLPTMFTERYMLCWNNQNIQQFTVHTYKYDERKGSM